MTNNRNYENRRNNRYNYSESEYVDIYSSRSRMPGKSKRPAPKKSGSGIIIAAIAFSLVAVIAATVFAVGAFTVRPIAGNTEPTIAIAAVAEKDANKTTQNNEASAQKTAVKTDAQSGQQTDDNIKLVNGDRVYIDTKRTAPAVTGNDAVYYAYGKTSYGFDWNYSADNSNFVIRCDYNFTQNQYQFHFYGVTPGVSHITLLYNIDDNTQTPVNLTLNVDNNLNAYFA